MTVSADRDGPEGVEYGHGSPDQLHEAGPAVRHHHPRRRVPQEHAQGRARPRHGLQESARRCR